MDQFRLTKGRVNLDTIVHYLSDDICIIVSGGDRPHVGAVAVSVSGFSLVDSEKSSVSTSIITLTGHKDDKVAKWMADTLAGDLKKNVTVICGIHLNNITPAEIEDVVLLVSEGIKKISSTYQCKMEAESSEL